MRWPAGALDDLDRPAAGVEQRVLQLVAGVAAPGKHVPQPREAVAHGGRKPWRAIAIPHVRRGHPQAHRQADDVGQKMPLATLIIFSAA